MACPGVELRRPSRPGTRPSAPAPERHIQQPRLGQPVEVERGEWPADPRARRGGIAIDRLGLRHDELVQPPAHRFGEGGEAVEVPGLAVLMCSQCNARKCWRKT